MYFYKDARISQENDIRLKSNINEYIKEVKKVQEVKRLLKLHVRNDLFNNRNLPDIRNRQYFPTILTKHAHMVSARRKMQLSLIHQEALIKKNYIWNQEDHSVKIFVRPKSTEALNNDERKNNIKAETQDMKFKNEDSVNYDDRTEDDIQEEEQQQEIKFKNEDSVHSLDATYKAARYISKLLELLLLGVKQNGL